MRNESTSTGEGSPLRKETELDVLESLGLVGSCHSALQAMQ